MSGRKYPNRRSLPLRSTRADSSSNGSDPYIPIASTSNGITNNNHVELELSTDEEDKWEVDSIKSKRVDVDASVHYLLKWKNWDGEPTWEPEDNCLCEQLIKNYEYELGRSCSSKNVTYPWATPPPPANPSKNKTVKSAEKKTKHKTVPLQFAKATRSSRHNI